MNWHNIIEQIIKDNNLDTKYLDLIVNKGSFDLTKEMIENDFDRQLFINLILSIRNSIDVSILRDGGSILIRSNKFKITLKKNKIALRKNIEFESFDEAYSDEFLKKYLILLLIFVGEQIIKRIDSAVLNLAALEEVFMFVDEPEFTEEDKTNILELTKRSGGMTTLMGWIKRYDDQGRILNSDPNATWGEITYKNKIYYYIRKYWETRLFKEPTSYLSYEHKEALLVFDETPDYIKNKG